MDIALLGKRIREERLRLRMTLEVLAEKIDKSTNFVGQIERGEANPSLETLVDIVNALGTTIDSLMRDETDICNEYYEKEINILFQSMDETGKQFILEVARRYKQLHDK